MKSTNLIGHIKFLLWRQLDGCSMTNPSLRRVWLARLYSLVRIFSFTWLQAKQALKGGVGSCLMLYQILISILKQEPHQA